jgi:hypothetical protein
MEAWVGAARHKGGNAVVTFGFLRKILPGFVKYNTFAPFLFDCENIAAFVD